LDFLFLLNYLWPDFDVALLIKRQKSLIQPCLSPPAVGQGQTGIFSKEGGASMYYMGIDLHKRYFVSTIMDKNV